MAKEQKNILQAVDDSVRAELRQLIANSRFASLGWLSAEDGHPLVSRVGLSTLDDGTPLLFISALAAHTGALEHDPRCSLLVGEPGKGDPLAHPRLTLKCRAQLVPTEQVAQARARYLATHKKAQLYIDLPDFQFVRLDIISGSFNGGFGRAYDVTPADLAITS